MQPLSRRNRATSQRNRTRQSSTSTSSWPNRTRRLICPATHCLQRPYNDWPRWNLIASIWVGCRCWWITTRTRRILLLSTWCHRKTSELLLATQTKAHRPLNSQWISSRSRKHPQPEDFKKSCPSVKILNTTAIIRSAITQPPLNQPTCSPISLALSLRRPAWPL